MENQGFCVVNDKIVSIVSLRSNCGEKRWLPLSDLKNNRHLLSGSDVHYYLRLYRHEVIGKECIEFFYQCYGIGCVGLGNFPTRKDLSKLGDLNLVLLFLGTVGELNSENETLIRCEKLRRSGMNFTGQDVFIDDEELRGKPASCYIEPRLKKLELFSGLENKISNERQTLMLLTLNTDEIWFCANEQEIRSEIYKRYHKFVTRDS